MLRKITFIIIDSIKKLLSLNKLRKNESKGFTSSLTTLNFLPYTTVTIPFSLGRTIRGVSFDKNLILDPFGMLCLGISKEVDEETLLENLSSKFNEEKDLSMADIIGIDKSFFQRYPAWAIAMPWEEISVEEMFKSYPESFYENRHSKGLYFEDKSRESIKKTMYSQLYAQNRLDQMKGLFESIKKIGITEKINLPKIIILIKDNEWRWVMGDGGNHRSYILSCLDNDLFSARVSAVINKNDVYNWYNVKNKAYTAKEAESIFDSYFNGSNVLRGLV